MENENVIEQEQEGVSDPTPENGVVMLPETLAVEETAEASPVVVFAFRLGEDERQMIKDAAKSAGWGRKQGGVTAWAREALRLAALAQLGR